MIDELCRKFGEEHRDLIIDALKFLEEREPKYNLKKPINKEKYIKNIIDGLTK